MGLIAINRGKAPIVTQQAAALLVVPPRVPSIAPVTGAENIVSTPTTVPATRVPPVAAASPGGPAGVPAYNPANQPRIEQLQKALSELQSALPEGKYQVDANTGRFYINGQWLNRDAALTAVGASANARQVAKELGLGVTASGLNTIEIVYQMSTLKGQPSGRPSGVMDASGRYIQTGQPSEQPVELTDKGVLSFKDWSTKTGITNQGVYQEYVKANETVPVSSVSTVTPDQLASMPGLKVGDKIATTRTGEVVKVGDAGTPLSAVQGINRLYAMDATRYDIRPVIAANVKVQQQQAEYQKPVSDWLQGQVDRGFAKNTEQAMQQLAEVQSGKHLAFVPDTNEPENTAKGRFVPVWSDFVKQREAAGLTPAQLGEIQSGKYQVPDATGKMAATTQSQFQQHQDRQAALDTLSGYKVGEGYNVAQYIYDNSRVTMAPKGAKAAAAPLPTQVVRTLRNAGYTDEQIATARVEAMRSQVGGIAPVQAGITKPNWIEQQTMGLENWTQQLVEAGRQEKGAFGSAMAGIGALGATTVLAAPTLVMQIAGKPSSTPKILYDTGAGMVTQVLNTASGLLGGGYVAAAKQGNLFPLVYDTGMTYMIVEGVGKGAKAAVAKITTYVAPRSLPFEAIGKEVSTGRIPVTQEELSKNFAEAQNKMLQLAATKGGSAVGEVPVEGTPLAIRYIKTPMQQLVGDVLFSGSKDVVSPSGEIITPSLTRIAEQTGRIVSGEVSRDNPTGALLYNDPWAAIGYSRGGQNPSLLMVITDSSKLKSGAAGLAKGTTESETYIRGVRKGFYGSSKTWKGDLETEIVGAPGATVDVPPPTADLTTRVLVGRYADFFTSDGGQFVPIKIGLDRGAFNPEVVAALKQPSTLYAIKLYTLYNTLQSVGEAMKHPGLVLRDTAGIFKEVLNVNRLVREGTGKGGEVTIPGVRDAYLVTKPGAAIREIVANLWNEAFRRTKSELGDSVAEDSAIFRDAQERNLSEAYRANADAMLNQFRAVSTAYAARPEVRSKFEAAYLANLGLSAQAIAKSTDLSISSLRDAVSDVSTFAPSDVSARTTESFDRTVSRAVSSGSPIATVSAVTSPVSEAVREARTGGVRTAESARSAVSAASLVAREPVSSVTSPRSAESPVTPFEAPRERPVERIPETPRPPRTPDTPREPPPTPRVPTSDRGKEPPSPPPPVIISRMQAHEPANAQPIPDGSIAWASGSIKGVHGILTPRWWYVPPDAWAKGGKQKPIPMSGPPEGASNTESNDPHSTLQVIGRSRTVTIPKQVDVDLGIMSVTIVGGKAIDFARDATVGAGDKSLALRASKETMLAQTGLGETIDTGIGAGTPVSAGVVNRGKMSKEKPRRTAATTKQEPPITALSGVRL